MAHNHGYEYQIRIVHEDGVEQLSRWMNDTEQVAQTMIAVHKPRGGTLSGFLFEMLFVPAARVGSRISNILLWYLSP